MKCKGCGEEMGEGETSDEYCDGYCVFCYPDYTNNKQAKEAGR